MGAGKGEAKMMEIFSIHIGLISNFLYENVLSCSDVIDDKERKSCENKAIIGGNIIFFGGTLLLLIVVYVTMKRQG